MEYELEKDISVLKQQIELKENEISELKNTLFKKSTESMIISHFKPVLEAIQYCKKNTILYKYDMTISQQGGASYHTNVYTILFDFHHMIDDPEILIKIKPMRLSYHKKEDADFAFGFIIGMLGSNKVNFKTVAVLTQKQ